VIEMTNSASVSNLTLDFDNFLFERIDKNSEGTPISVLSVLARLGVDPWEEAARLAQLPRLAAAKSLASMIAAAMPGAPSACLDAGSVSDHLISLLPSPPVVTVLPRLKSGVRPPGTSRLAVLMLLAAILLVIKLVLVIY
jgi:hypothetical protein